MYRFILIYTTVYRFIVLNIIYSIYIYMYDKLLICWAMRFFTTVVFVSGLPRHTVESEGIPTAEGAGTAPSAGGNMMTSWSFTCHAGNDTF